MSEYLEAVSALRKVAGWSWWRAAVFVWEYGPRMAKISVSATEGVRERFESDGGHTHN